MLLHDKSVVLFDDFYLNNRQLSKKFGCNFIYENKKFNREYFFKLLPFTDCFGSKKNRKCIKIMKVTKR